jgi:hypothetical protein
MALPGYPIASAKSFGVPNQFWYPSHPISSIAILYQTIFGNGVAQHASVLYFFFTAKLFFS